MVTGCPAETDGAQRECRLGQPSCRLPEFLEVLDTVLLEVILFQQLNHFTARTASGGLQVTGRLLTVQSAKLAPVTNGTEPGSKKVGPELLSGTITATAYVLPASQGLTGGATATSPGSRGSSASSLSSTGSGASAPTAPAIARVTP